MTSSAQQLQTFSTEIIQLRHSLQNLEIELQTQISLVRNSKIYSFSSFDLLFHFLKISFELHFDSHSIHVNNVKSILKDGYTIYEPHVSSNKAKANALYFELCVH